MVPAPLWYVPSPLVLPAAPCGTSSLVVPSVLCYQHLLWYPAPLWYQLPCGTSPLVVPSLLVVPAPSNAALVSSLMWVHGRTSCYKRLALHCYVLISDCTTHSDPSPSLYMYVFLTCVLFGVADVHNVKLSTYARSQMDQVQTIMVHQVGPI